MDNTKYLKSDIVSKPVIRRWDLHYCSLDQDILPDSGSVLIGKANRPCLIVSSNEYNQISDKVLVMPYCSNNRDDLTDEEYVKQAAERGETLIPMVLNRNARSFLIIDQPRLIARKMLRGYVGTLDVEANEKLAIKVTEAVFKYMIDTEVFMKTEIFKSMFNYSLAANNISPAKDESVSIPPKNDEEPKLVPNTITEDYGVICMRRSKEENAKYALAI